MTAELGFGLLALILVGVPALRVVTSGNLVRAILWLAATLLGTAVLYALLHAAFLAGVQVLTYVGGVVTLMVFGVMVTRKHEGTTFTIDGTGRLRGALAALGFFAVVAAAIVRTDLPHSPWSSPRRPRTSPSPCSTATSWPSRSPRSCCWRPSSAPSCLRGGRSAPDPADPEDAAALREGSTP